MTTSARRLILGASFFTLTCVVAVSGYMYAGWLFLDAVYMVVITVFGVGYGETKPLDNAALKVFTMGVIIAGCSSGIYVVGGLVQMIAEGEINRALGARRMSQGIDKLTNHAVICGFGRVGQMLCSDLSAAKQSFVVVDNSQERIADAHAKGYLAVLGSASEESILQAAGIERARVMATVLPDDTANVFITLTARELNAKLDIIARAESPSTEKKLLRSGANRIVMPALIGATKIAHMIVRPTAEEVLLEGTGTTFLNEELKLIGLELIEIVLQANSPLVGETIGDIEVGNNTGIVVVAVRKADGTLVRNPEAKATLGARDVLMIVAHRESVPLLARRAKGRSVSFRGATT